MSYDVETLAATNICQGGATLNGYVNPFFSNDTTRWFEWGYSPDYLPNQTAVTRNGYNTEYFKQDIQNLLPDTPYYFRVVAQNSKGVGRGDISGFQTNNDLICPVFRNTGPIVGVVDQGGASITSSQSVITKPATHITDTSAQMNAVALPAGFIPTYGWFEWGGTPDFGYVTARQYIGVGQSLLYNGTMSGLTPGTAYFFQPVIENQNGLAKGVIFSFRTTGTPPILPATTPTDSATNKITTKTPPITQKTETIQASTTQSKAIRIDITSSTDTAAPKEHFNETIRLENTTDVVQKDVVVRVLLSCDTEYIPTENNKFSQIGQMLVYRVGNIGPKEKKNLLFWAGINSGVADKRPIEIIAVVNWEDKTHTNDAQNIAHAVVTVDKNKAKSNGADTANKQRSRAILPNTIKDWGAVIGILFLAISVYMVFLAIRRRNSSDDTNKQSETDTSAGHRHQMGNPSDVLPHDSEKDPFLTRKNKEEHVSNPHTPPIKKQITEKGFPPENLPI